MNVDTIRGLPLFAGLSERELQQVAAWADEIDVEINHRLIRREELGHEFFVVVDGTAEAMDGEIHLADLARGDFFGEISLLEHDRRTASVRATAPMRLMVMPEQHFRAMMQAMPQVAERIQVKVDERREASEYSKG
jgi:cAMP-dependent protein kinase regulator